MRVPSKVILFAKIIGTTLTVIGVIDLPDQIQRWGKWLQTIRGINVNWEVEILGNGGRWAFTLSGLALLLWAYRVPSMLWNRFKPESRSAAPGAGGTLYKLEETSDIKSIWWRLAEIIARVEPISLPPGYIGLRDAAIELYTYTRGKNHILSRIAEDMSGWKEGRTTEGSADEILDYMATYMAFCKKVPIGGKRVPSKAFESINHDEIRKCRFVGGATRLERTYNDSIYYIDLAVEADAFQEFMANVHMDDGFYDPKS